MTTYDLIDVYQFDFVSSLHKGNPKKYHTMVEEMNEIREKYKNGTAIDDVLRNSVCVRHGHQYCISEVAVEEAVKRLLKASVKRKPFVNGNNLNEDFADFEELYDFVNAVIGSVSGIGSLTVYDTAKRLGHLFEKPIYPKAYVYLSAGALDGAKVLLKGKKLSFREPAMVFEPFFGTLPSVFVEDILCIFKNQFRPMSIEIKGTNKALMTTGNCVFKNRKKQVVV